MADIEIDTSLLRQYADMIDRTRRRASNLDCRVEALYNRTGLVDLQKLVGEDTLARYTYHLSRCRDYLLETAQDFESVEKMLSGVDPAKDFQGDIYSYVPVIVSSESIMK